MISACDCCLRVLTVTLTVLVVKRDSRRPRDAELTFSALPCRLCLSFLAHVCAHTGGLPVPLPVSSPDCDQLTGREDTKCVIPDDRPRDEGEGPPFVCVRGGCEEVGLFAKTI